MQDSRCQVPLCASPKHLCACPLLQACLSAAEKQVLLQTLVNLKDSRGQVPLHVAVQSQNAEAVRAILSIPQVCTVSPN